MIHDDPQNDRMSRFQEFMEGYCDGTLSAEHTAMLEQQLREDPQALDHFVRYLEVHSRIAWDVRAHAGGLAAR